MSENEWENLRDEMADEDATKVFLIAEVFSATQAATMMKVEAMFNSVYLALGSNDEKFSAWFITPNPMFGMATPLHLIQLGKLEKLMKFVEASYDRE